MPFAFYAAAVSIKGKNAKEEGMPPSPIASGEPLKASRYT